MCVSAMQLTAAVYSQEVKVTLSVKDASFESVIRLLEANTEYTFLYEDRHIAEIGGLNLKRILRLCWINVCKEQI